MMLAYRLWTWTAIAILAFGSIAVFVVFLVTTLRRLRGERNPAAAPRPRKNHRPPVRK
jgi:hypothetical protein